jgi:hypothetical protein
MDSSSPNPAKRQLIVQVVLDQETRLISTIVSYHCGVYLALFELDPTPQEHSEYYAS